MKHVLVTEAAHAAPNTFVALGDEKSKHLRRVLRMEWDEPVRVLDGAGRLLAGTLEKHGASGGGIRLTSVERTEPSGAPLELVIVLPKNATMDWVVEKAVECGVTAIYPVVTSRSVVKPGKEDGSKYVRRWQTIMDGAVEQSERLWRPEIQAPLAWEKWISSASEMKSFAFVSELRVSGITDEQAMRECWKQLQSAGSGAMRLLIGPEGGFSDIEREEMTRRGFIALSLGATVLRVETAVVAALTLARASRLISAV